MTHKIKCELNHKWYKQKKIDIYTFGSPSFFCNNWCNTSTHSENLSDWKNIKASLASIAVTERAPSSSAPSRTTFIGDDEVESRESIQRSNQISLTQTQNQQNKEQEMQPKKSTKTLAFSAKPFLKLKSQNCMLHRSKSSL